MTSSPGESTGCKNQGSTGGKIGFAAKSFSWWQGVGCGVWGVGVYPFSGGQLPNFQGKSP
ncbi:Mobile element protein [Microcystis aeruginosa NIES-98]|nr:Mobile element protein [Microcystis aeruginosa NIES-98]